MKDETAEIMLNIMFETLDEIDRNGGVTHLEVRKIAEQIDTLKYVYDSTTYVLDALHQLGYNCRRTIGCDSDYKHRGVYFETEEGYWTFCFQHRKKSILPNVETFKDIYITKLSN